MNIAQKIRKSSRSTDKEQERGEEQSNAPANEHNLLN